MIARILTQLFIGFYLLIALCLFYSFKPFIETPVKEDSFITKDTLLARQLLKQEKKLYNEGNSKKAYEVLEQAKNLYRKHQLWEAAINCIIKLATYENSFPDLSSSNQYSYLAVELSQKHLSDNHPLLASAFRQKAEAFIQIGKVDSSNLLLLQAIPILEKHQVWADLAWSKIILGVNLLNAYQLDKSQLYLESADSLLYEQNLEEEDSITIQSTILSLMGVLYQLQGDYQQAIKVTNRALKIDRRNIPIDSAAIGTHLANLGNFHLTKGDYQRALDYFLQALGSYPNANSSLFYDIGELSRLQGKYTGALRYFQKSLSESRTQADKINGWIGMILTFIDLGVYESAADYAKKVIDFDKSHRQGWLLLGVTYKVQKKTNQAIECFKKAEEICWQDSTILKYSPFYLAQVYKHLGDVHLLTDNADKALELYQKALVYNHQNFNDSLNYQVNPPLTRIFTPQYFLNSLHGKAKTLTTFSNDTNKMRAALDTYQLLIQWTDSLQIGHTTEAASLDWTERFKEIYGEAIGVAYHHYQQTQDLQYLNLAFYFSEKSKNNLLLNSLKASEGKAYAGVPDSFLQKEKDLNIDVAFYEKSLQKAQTTQDTSKIQLYQRYLSETRLNLVELREQLEESFPKFHELKYGGNSLSIQEVQSQLLDKQTAFVEYFIGDSTTFAFVLTSNSAQLLPLETPQKLEKTVANFRTVLLDLEAFQKDTKAAAADYQQKATQVYQTILQPITANLPDKITQLVIVPDEFLNSLPFEALTTSNEEIKGFDFGKLPYLLHDYQIQYAYSANLLRKNQKRQTQIPSNVECLAFAPPYQERGGTFARRGDMESLRSSAVHLEGTASEIQAIAQYFKGQFDFGETATERRFKEVATQFGILHLAMHGVPDFDNANFNHLIFTDLAQGQDTLEDNLLHHYEIANMNLQAQLAVLSACETGVGKYEKGEGVYSLARSFMYAGVPSVVMSLWKVSDVSTSKIMPFFYENLANGSSKGDALHSAKVRFLEESSMRYRHPFYWSAFVLVGDAQPLNRGNDWWIWLGVLVFMGLGAFSILRIKMN